MPPHALSNGVDVEAVALDGIEMDINGNIKLVRSPPSSPRSVSHQASLMDMVFEDDDDIIDKSLDGAGSVDSETIQQDHHCGMIYDSFTNLCASAPRSALKKKYPGVEMKPSRSVSFNSISIREHNITLGDHPSSASGPPIQLDWEPKNVSTMSLEDYENARQPRRRRRQLKLSFQEREEILQTNGFTMDQLKEAWMESLKIRQQRYETLVQGSLTTKMEEAWESACRKFNRLWAVDESAEGLDVRAPSTTVPPRFNTQVSI